MTLDDRQEEFRREPCTATARRYAEELLDYWSDDMIGKDTVRAGFHEIAEGLTEGCCDLGHKVSVEVRRA